MADPTMNGFIWSSTNIDAVHRSLPGDLWCVRDVVCTLLAWPPGSDDWKRFIEAPSASDVDRMTDHLGLVWFDPEHPPHHAQLVALLDHPGISVFAFPSLELCHYVYQPHVRHLRGLPSSYDGIPRELFRIVIDPRRPAARTACTACRSAA